jgi:MFS family permease
LLDSPDDCSGVRTTVILSAAVNFFTMIFIGAVGPLLPHLSDEFGLSKSEAGVLIALYAAGVLVAAVPAGVAVARFGVRRAVATGLALFAGASLLFALAPTAEWLYASRFGQGAGAAIAWTGALAWLIAAVPARRRAEYMGTASALSVGGALLGPVLGGIAAGAGLAQTFVPAALLGFVLGGVVLLQPEPPRAEPRALRTLVPELRRPRVTTGLTLGFLSALLWAVLSVLAPLSLDELGWDTAGISGVFLVSAVVGAVWNPFLGRLSDRLGRLAPVRVGLVAACGILVALPLVHERWVAAALVVAAGLGFGVFWLNGMALLADAASRRGIDHGLTLMLMNLGWAVATLLGAGVGGAVADAAGDVVTYFALAGACVLVALAVRPRASLPVPAQA